MKPAPAISVVIPTYNHGSFISETLRSVFGQTFSDYEVIVVNDGSPDDTAEVLRPLRDSRRIRYFEQANAGQASARNFGLNQAEAEFIAFLDDDDLWPADKLAWQFSYLRSCGAPLVAGTAALFRTGAAPHLHLAPRVDRLGIPELATGCPFVSPGQTLIRRSALLRIGGFDPSVWGTDDFDLYLRLVQEGELRCDRRIGLRYRVHPGNASKNRTKMLSNSFLVVRRYFPFGDPLSRRAYRSLYVSAGREWVLAARRSLHDMHLRSALVNLLQIRGFASAALRDFVLAKRIVLDLVPERFSSQEAALAHHIMVGVDAPGGADESLTPSETSLAPSS